jgi:hypothetical protein
MTVSNQVTKRIYQGNDITREWEIDFPLISPADLKVYLTSPDGEETLLTTGYTLNASATLLTYPTVDSGLAPLGSGWTITLVRATPLTQEIDLVRQGDLDAEVLEQGYDKLTLLLQELQEVLSRSIKFPVSAPAASTDTESFLRKLLEVESAAQSAFAVWGNLIGTLSDQTDLKNALDAKQNTLTAGTGIAINNNVISNTQTSAEWGNITGTLSAQTDLQSALNAKQNALTAGTNITLSGNTISAAGASTVILRDWSV